MRDDIKFLDSLAREYSAGLFAPVGFKLRWMIEHIETNHPPSPEREAHLSNARRLLAAHGDEEEVLEFLKKMARKYYFEGNDQASEVVRSLIDYVDKNLPSSPMRDRTLEWARQLLMLGRQGREERSLPSIEPP
jgi:hypothetical protein